MMVRYYVWPIAVILGWAALGYAQEPGPIEPPPLPTSGAGWVDMLVKFSPVLLGLLAPFGNDVMKKVAPMTLGKLPTPAVMAISTVVSMLASGMTAYVTGLGMDGGGVQPSVAVVETLGTNALSQTVKQSRPTTPHVGDEPPKES